METATVTPTPVAPLVVAATSAQAALLQLAGIGKTFHTDDVETRALANVELSVAKGEFVSISGPSGSGKSTLLAILGLLDVPTAGEYRIDGQDTAKLDSVKRAALRNKSIGFIFQAFNLIGDLSVEENVELPLTYRGMDKAERKKRVAEALESVRMSHRARHLPAQLSGGQQQRVAVARAVAGNPLILLADEPTGNLDSKNGDAVMELLCQLHANGATIIMVTHNPDYAQKATRIVHLFDGRVVEDRPPGPDDPRLMVVASPRLLVADDQPDVLEAVKMLARANGFDVRTTTSPAGVQAICEAEEIDVCLLDLNYARDTTSGTEGMSLLAKLRDLDPTLPVVVMTAWATIEGAVEAMRRGARDYIQKPWDNARLLATLNAQLELRNALRTANRLDAEAARMREKEHVALVAKSRAMQAVVTLVERVASSNASVLITGEHGTGKEIIARALHAKSARSNRAFIAVNAGGLSDGVLDSELFGHVKGAFTDARTDRVGCFELADGGTLFLDEIANMPLAQQSRLLRVLQTGELTPVGSSRQRKVDVRVLAATNVDIAREAGESRFREDLLYRLNTVEIRLPPLRERREDIPDLVAQFLAGRKIATAAMEALLAHPWPGNVRELEHVIERASLLATSGEITPNDLMLRTRTDAPPRLEEMTLEEVERYLIERALAAQGGNVSEAARVLGLSRSALYRRLASLRGV